MTDQQIRIALAEGCGWIKVREHWEKDGQSAFLNDCIHYQQLPDYAKSLDAMHEAEKTLEDSENRGVSFYFEMLHKVVGSLSDNPQWRMIHATARQRAEALLRTLGKWIE